MEQWVKMSQLLFTHLPSCVTAVGTGRAHTKAAESGKTTRELPQPSLFALLCAILHPAPLQCQGAVWQRVIISLSKAVHCWNYPPQSESQRG